MLDSAVALDVFQEIFDHVSTSIKPGAAGSGALLVYGGVDKIFYVNKDFGVLDPKVLALDALVLTLTIGAVVHAALAGKLVRLPLYFLIGLTLEQSSVRLGGTHCHSDGIVMVSKCSSLNSVAYYVPWIHLALEVAGRLSLGFVARVFVAGLLGFSLCGVYEVQGPRQGWWAYPVHKDTGLPLTSKLWTLHGGLSNVFAVNDHAGLALAERWHGMPVMAILFHASFLLGLAVGGGVGGGTLRLVPSSGALRLPLKLIAAAAAAVLAPAAALVSGLGFLDLPVRGLETRGGISKFASVPAMLLLMLLPCVLFPAASKAPPSRSFADRWGLFLLYLLHHAFFVFGPPIVDGGLADGTTPPELYLAVCVVAAFSVAASARAAYAPAAPASAAAAKSSKHYHSPSNIPKAKAKAA